MLSINTNLPSLIAQKSLMNSTKLLNKAVERMSTGFKVNHASDNAANYSIVTNMNTKIGAYQVAEDNVAMGLDLITTASESLDLMNDKLVRLRALAEQAANGTYGEQSLKAINAEANALVDEIVRTRANTEYNGINLFGESKPQFIEEVVKRDTSGMTALASVDKNTAISSGTYSISTAEELAKLAEMTNSGKVSGGEFVLANDIDLGGYSDWSPIGDRTCHDPGFKGNFDGNGYVISNLRGSNGLFHTINGTSEIKNLGLENVNISRGSGKNSTETGGLADEGFGDKIINCYVTGNITSVSNEVGGLVGNGAPDIIDKCFTSVNINGDYYVGGLVGYHSGGTVSHSYSTGTINGGSYVGGLIGYTEDVTISDSYSTCDVSGVDSGDFVGESNSSSDRIINCYAVKGSKTKGFAGILTGTASVDSKSKTLNSGEARPFTYEKEIDPVNVNMQIGIYGNNDSQIKLNTAFDMRQVNLLRGIGYQNNVLSTIDNIINQVSAKQTELGSTQNRLESALDEISTQYENLVSSRSTLRDADIAQVSSEYIRQQILQQASATLLATANQTPTLALQLL